jgi:hypothetical protein
MTFEKSIQPYWVRVEKNSFKKVEELERSVSIDFRGRVP